MSQLPHPPTAEPILVAAGEHGLAASMRRTLEQRGWSVECVASGREALDWLARRQAALLVLDADSAAVDATAWPAELRGAARPVRLVVCADLSAQRADGQFLRSAAVCLHKGPLLCELLGDAVDRLLQQDHVVRQLAETTERLSVADQLLCEVVEAAGGGRCERDFDSGRRTWSPRIFEILGIAPTDSLDSVERLKTEFVGPGDYQPMMRALERHLKSGEPLDLEFRLTRPDRAKRWLHVIGRMVRDADGKPLRGIGVVLDVTDQRDAGQQLQRSEQMIQTLTMNSREAIVVVDAAGAIVYASPRVVRITGRPDSEALRREFWEHLHPDDAARVRAEWRDHIAHPEQVRTMTVRLIHGDGTWRWIEGVSQNMLHDPSVGGMLINFRDVTVRRRSEVFLEHERIALTRLISPAALEECLESILRAIDAHLPGARSVLYYADGAGRDAGAIAAPGLPGFDDAIVRAHCAATLSVRSAEQAALGPQLVVVPSEIPLAGLIPDYAPGRPLCSAYLAPVVDADGRSLGLLILFFDHRATADWIEGTLLGRAVDSIRLAIEHKRAAAALEQSEQRYRGLIQRAPLAILVSTQGRFVFANDAAVALLGVANQEQLLHRPTSDFIRPDLHRHESLGLQEILAGSLTSPATEACFVRADGKLVEVEVSSIQCLYDGAASLQVVLQDISERKRVDEEARERQGQIAHLMRLNAIGQMAAELAHEINQPLYAITNYASAALELMETQRAQAPREALAWLKNITEQANRAGNILRRIGRFVRKDPPLREEFLLNDALWDTAALLEFDLRSHGVRLNMTLTEPSPKVVVDRLQIEQVLVNLIHNAVHAMEQAPRDERNLTLRTRTVGDQVEVAVKDSGPGPSGEKLARLFQPFYTTKPSGLGLGLSISRSIVEAHRGRLWVEPNRDRGVTFRFTLPTLAREENHDQ